MEVEHCAQACMDKIINIFEIAVGIRINFTLHFYSTKNNKQRQQENVRGQKEPSPALPYRVEE
jgi:hypothetical protein